MPLSELRKESISHIEKFVAQLPPTVKDVLDIGIAGDVEGGGNRYLFPTKSYKTMDIVADLKPDIVADITTIDTFQTAQPGGYPQFDLVILSNTLEHIFEKEKALEGCWALLRGGGYLLLDIPWQYPYHQSAESDDYWRVSAKGLELMLEKAEFKNITSRQGQYCSVAMGQK